VIILRGYPADAPDVVGEEHYLEFCLGFLVACDVVERTVNCYLVAALHLGVNAEGFGELTAHGRIHAAGVDNEVGIFVALVGLDARYSVAEQYRREHLAFIDYVDPAVEGVIYQVLIDIAALHLYLKLILWDMLLQGLL